jgi:RNA polymerase sigma factor (TIGR02999 family)
MSENQSESPETALSGQPAAPDASVGLLEEAYEELKAVAGAVFRRERGDHTLQPTALVHEAWMRLAGQRDARWTGKAHFLVVAAEVMRRLLVDHARKRATLRRGGDAEHLAIDADLLPGPESEVALVDLDDALERLQSLDPERALVVVRRVFGGMTNAEIGQAEGVSERTIERRWRAACAWLAKDLRSGARD